MQDCTIDKNRRGFTLIEVLIVVTVIVILAAVAVPNIMKTVSDIQLRYYATNMSGLLQSARIQAVRRNAFYTLQPTNLPTGVPAYYIDQNNGAYVAGDPVVPLSNGVTFFSGIGSGAPNEGGFIAGLNFAVNAGVNLPSFNARGLPCVAAGNVCPQAPGQGFVLFLSKPDATGNTNWASIVVNPSGRIQVWTCDSAGAWVQR